MKLYTIARDGEELGAWDADTVWAKIAAGQILPTDHAWADGMADWSTVSRLFPSAPPPPAPAPVPQPAYQHPTTRPPSAGVAFKAVGGLAMLAGVLMFVLAAEPSEPSATRHEPRPQGYYLTAFLLALGGLASFVVGRFDD